MANHGDEEFLEDVCRMELEQDPLKCLELDRYGPLVLVNLPGSIP